MLARVCTAAHPLVCTAAHPLVCTAAHPLHWSERKREREGEIEIEKEGGRESTPAPLQLLSTPVP